jgi:hypothetical protein
VTMIWTLTMSSNTNLKPSLKGLATTPHRMFLLPLPEARLLRTA